MRALLTLLLSVLLVAGCKAPVSVPDLPPKLTNQGLLVARFYMPGNAMWENARIDIDGKLREASLRDGYVAIALEPGEHHFVQLRLEGQRLVQADEPGAAVRQVKGGGGFYYIPGGTYTIHFTTLSVNRRFTIQPDRVTNLGLIVYISADDPKKERATVDQARQYYAVPVDNSAEMNYYLQTNFSGLLSTIKDPAPKLAPGNYLDAARLPELRKTIGALEARSGRYVATDGYTAAYGDAGTIVVVENNVPKPPLNVLDTGTLANIVDARVRDEKMFFLTSSAQLLTVEGGQLSTMMLPEKIQPVRMAIPGDGQFVVVDNRLRILTSRDAGQTWDKNESAMIDRPRSDIGLTQDDEGAYIYIGRRGLPSSILFLPAGASAARSIALPVRDTQPVRGPSALLARKAGLFIVSNDRDFWFRARETQRWELYSKPGGKCKGMGIDPVGVELKIECDGIPHRSLNSGKTWAPASAT